MATLSTCNLSIGYQQPGRSVKTICSDINVSLKPGELVCLLGPNGAGKSTLMRTLVGMQRPISGTVQLNQTDVSEMSAQEIAKTISVVLTEKVSVGMLSTYALVALGRYPHTNWRGKLSAADEQIVQNAILSVGAEKLATRYINELSDGERQKVMIARALAQSPEIMLLDEPTAFLDLPHRVEIMQILRRLAHDKNHAILLSTHDLDLALRIADTIWLMVEGRPMAVGIPEDLVLNGIFSQSFDTASVAFDLQSGIFQFTQPQKMPIQLSGDGLGATWVGRALEREGYPVQRKNNDDAPLPVRVIAFATEDNRPAWRVETTHQTTECLSIQHVLNVIKTGRAAR